jgi:hypothetical protein
MARAATPRDDAESSNQATEERHWLGSIEVVLPLPLRQGKPSATTQRDVDATALSIIRDAVRKNVADGRRKIGAAQTLLSAISFALMHAHNLVPIERNRKWTIGTAKTCWSGLPHWSVANLSAWSIVLLDEWIVQASGIIADPKCLRDVETIKTVDEVMTFGGRGGFAHEVALQYAEHVREEAIGALKAQPAVRRDRVLVADMKTGRDDGYSTFGGPAKSLSDEIIARLFNKATKSKLTFDVLPDGRPSEEEFEMLDAKLDATIAKLPRPDRKGAKASQDANATEATNPGGRPPLSNRERAVFDFLTSLPKGTARKGEQIVQTLSHANPAVHISVSSLTKDIIPKLKAWGVRNRRGVGYYVDVPGT